MNLVGKIFIVLIFVMSILFMGFTVAVYATHTNWRNEVMDPETGLQAQLKNVKLEVERLTEDKTDTEKELAIQERARQNQLAQLETQKESLAKELNQLNDDYADAKQEAREAVGAMKAAHDSLAALRQEVETLRQQIDDAYKMRDEALDSLVAKTDEANETAVEMQTLQKQATLVSEQLADAMEVLRKFDLKAEPAVYSDTPPQGIPGLVLAVTPDGLVEVSLGEDDGLRVGHRLDVYRTNGTSKYLGKIEVVETDPDRAACKILPQFQQGSIQANDRVSTGLKSR